MSYNIGLQVLRAKVRGFQAAGATISSYISKSEKERKNHLWNEKRSLGLHCRYHLVAYGLLRGTPYEQIERCAPRNKLDPQRLLDIINMHHNGWNPLLQYKKFDLETVKSLLAQAVQEMQTSPSTTPSRPFSTAQKALASLKQLLEKSP